MIFCPDVAIVRTPPLSPPTFRGDGGYEINYDYCKGCGICAEECPRYAISIEEELKWKK